MLSDSVYSWLFVFGVFDGLHLALFLARKIFFIPDSLSGLWNILNHDIGTCSVSRWQSILTGVEVARVVELTLTDLGACVNRVVATFLEVGEWLSLG